MEAYWANHSQRIMRMREYAHKLRVDAFNRYGGPKCACCGETSWAFLSLDHINGGGCKHRREMKGGGLFTYRWLKKHGYPEGYQVLCMNCNFGKAQNGGICPHEENKIKTKNP